MNIRNLFPLRRNTVTNRHLGNASDNRPTPRKIERPEISYPKMLAHDMQPRQSRLSDGRSLHALFALQCHKLDAARVALDKLGYGNTPDAQLLKNMSAQLSASRFKEDRPVLPNDTASMKRLNDELVQIVSRHLRNMCTTPSTALPEARKLLRQADTELLNQQEWKTITTTVTYDGRKYGCELTPASQMKLGAQDIFERSYNDQGVCSASTTEAQHATNLWQSELTALQEDGSSKLLFRGIRHGVLSPFGLDDPELREQGAIRRAKEVVTAALFSRPDELRNALAGETVTLRLASCSLLTPFGQEKTMLRDQASAWKALSGCIQPIALSIRDQNGQLCNIKVRLDVAAFNFAVNEPALKLGLGHRESDRMNEQALHTLIGPDLNPSAPLGGWVGQYLIGRPKNAECIRTMVTQLKEIWAQHAHRKDGGEPYKAAQRVAMLAYEIGAVPCWNCKSGKDRTGMLDAEIKREAITQHEGHPPSRPMAGLTEPMQRLFRAVLLDGGNLAVQEKNTGASGNKVLKTLPFRQLLNLSYAKRVGDAGVHQQARGLSSLV
ncbi:MULTISPECIES: inositol phosphate phosphatase SopB [Burkholderia]|uniref:inositol phosphate phosphatase SopB n=1 Tax=Burkholderia TaxID=32008 RepID=UPI0012E387DE|nr:MULTISPECIES: inositol phosphate phosphatase SopB [Burkholderia]